MLIEVYVTSISYASQSSCPLKLMQHIELTTGRYSQAFAGLEPERIVSQMNEAALLYLRCLRRVTLRDWRK